MGESLLTPAVSGLLDTAYIGIAVTLVVIVLCAGLFVRIRWAGLLFWSGTALGALLGQAYALWVTGETSSFSLWTHGAIGAVLGMPAGGILADWWQDRQVVHDVVAAPVAATQRRGPAAHVRHQHVDHQRVEVEDYPLYEAEAI